MLITSWLRSVQTRLILNRRRSQRRRTERDAQGKTAESLEERALLVAPTLVAVLPNVGEFLAPDEVRNVAPQQITLQFNPGQQIDATTLGAITITRAGGDDTFNNGNDVDVPIGFAGLGDLPEDVVLRFSENLPDDKYLINIDGASSTPLTNEAGEVYNNGTSTSFPFELDLGAQVVSVVPQPVKRRANGTLQQDRKSIVVYFNDDDLDQARAEDPMFYDLIFTNDTVTNQDDQTFNPATVTYDPVADTATLTFGVNLHNLAGAGTFRLRIGTDEATPPVPIETTPGTDPGDAYRTANTLVGDISAIGNTSYLISAAIDPEPYGLDWPGAIHEPGHRDIEAERHYITGADTTDGVTTVFYNFQDDYGFDPLGNQLKNLITENQKDRAREVFELFSVYAGLDFVETDNLGLTVVTGDPRAINPSLGDGPGGLLHAWDRNRGLVIMDAAENWNDEFAPPGAKPSWIFESMAGIGRLLGLGYSGELPELTALGDEVLAGNGTTPETDLPNDPDIIHLRHLFRPDSNDIDLYEFTVTDAGVFTAETIAERRANSTNLDSTLRLFGEDDDGNMVLVAQNDDYFSDDSFIEIELQPGTYYIGVSASGNDDYDPTIARTGINGTSQGEYDLRLNFRPDADDTLLDTTGTAFDGDRDGLPGGVENFWFRAVHPNDQLLVDKVAPNGGDGRTSAPFNQIDVAFANSQPGDLVRIVGNPGADNDISTIDDNVAYQIGFDLNSTPLPLVDGARMDVPQGVTTVIDEGAILKFHRARIGVGSPTSSVDHSGAAVQILGVPGNDVILTSWLDESVGEDTTPSPTNPSPGNWGGVMFQNNVDKAEQRFNYDDQGIYLNYISHGRFEYGGGSVVVNSQARTVNPIHMTQARPTAVHNTIRLSADSAISADPDSFEETNFHSPRYQGSSAFTSDYGRVGPDLYGNHVTQNSTNGLFVRVETPPGSPTNRLTVPGRFDDTDLVHVITGNLEIVGTPGGAVLDATSPSVILVKLTEQPGNGTLTAGVYNYRLVFVDASGNESPASETTRNVTVSGGTSAVLLENLPPAPAPFVGRRLYRSDPAASAPHQLIANLDVSDTSYVDDGTTLTGNLIPAAALQLARFNARLAVDPGTIVKLDQANFELGFGADFIAEGDLGREIIFTSRKDDRFGVGGTFDTNNDDNDPVEATPDRGNWGGIYGGHLSSLSLDRTLVTFGGGITPLEGDFATFNVIEVHQADARLTNSVFENNADGTGGSAPANRFGRLPNASATIFVRGSQPVVVDNIIRDSDGPAASFNVNSLNHEFVRDAGRARGLANRIVTFADNQGPLVRGNILGRNAINGLEVRGETVTTGVVMDDTGIVHVVRSEIYIPDLHTFGGVTLASSSDESLVVKLDGANAGFTANGRPLDIDDRIGGQLQIIGQPFRPVVLTSLADDSIGSGFGLDGLPLTDTNGDGNATTPNPGDWRSVKIDQFAHDRNVDAIVENETANELSPDTNGGVTIAEFLGELGEHEKDSDENLRLGFQVTGSVSRAEDADVYSFRATSGTEIWIELDQTRHALDGVVELLNANGQILAQSDNSFDEVRGTMSVHIGAGAPNANVLTKSVHEGVDYYSTNPHDPGFRVVLPGTVGSVGTFFIRVRSSNIDSADPSADRADLLDPTKVNDGLTFGGYQLNVRLRERDEAPGSTVRYGDIRYASTGIEIIGHPSHSPLAGELAENANGADNNNTRFQAQDAGNLGNSDRATLAFSGRISTSTDVDFFEFDVIHDSTESGDPFPDLHVPVTIDLDYADGLSRANTIVSIFDDAGRLVYMGRDSNVSDDRSAPLNGADLDDLSRGSVGPQDPFIGPIELAVGKYFLAVSSNDRIPRSYEQFSNRNNGTFTRLEPITTVHRIADEQFGNDFQRTAAPTQTDLFTTFVDPQGNVRLDPKHTEFHLSDVSLYVSAAGMAGARTGLYMVDGFTGGVVNHVGQSGIRIDDIAMRPDGDLFSYANSTFNNMPPNDANLGHYVLIDTDDGEINDLGDEGPTTWVAGQCLPPPATGVTQAQVGLGYTAMHFTGTDTNDGLAVGHNVARSGNAWPSYFEYNALFNFNIVTGATINQNVLPRLGDARACDGVHTNLYEVGKIDTVPDGVIQGLAEVGDQLYGLDQFGNLYAIDYTLFPFQPRSVTTTPVKQVIDRPFRGLVAGPGAGTEGGAYEDLLFGITVDGDIYVFDTNGDLQPVLAGGSHVVSTGIPGVTGIAFGTLDYNLWEVTADRANDVGHGTEATPDGSRGAAPGSTSLHFGNQVGAPDAGNKNNLSATVQRNYNFPGGAQGEVVSNYFSLEGYASGDKPTLYFNYYLETENTDGAGISDSLRVYVGGDETIIDTTTGNMTPWSLVATNNETYTAGAGNDEFDYGVGPLPTEFPATQGFANEQPLFDNTNRWRQVRVDLSAFAGQDNLRLRFVFASSGTLNIGQRATQNPFVFGASGGEEIYAIDGKDLRDGQQFTLLGPAGPETFTFDLGYTLITPSGGSISDGDTFTVSGTVFEFDSTGATTTGFAVPFTPDMTANEIATNVGDAVTTFLSGTVLATLDENRVNLSNAATLSQTGALVIEGTPGGGPNTIAIHSGMDRDTVAEQMRLVFADVLNNGSREAVQGTGNKISLKNESILDPGPLPAGNMLPGDEFGFADSPIAGPSPRGSNNAFNGVYIDDVIIGFAERGEMATATPNDSSFVDHFEVNNPAVGSPPDILVGAYVAEVRRTSEFGFSQAGTPSLILTRTIDTNDRVGNLTSLTIPSGGDVSDGETFSISDGTNLVVFEFDDIRAANGVEQGHFGISFDPFMGSSGDEIVDPAEILAAKVRNAINSNAVQGILNIVAGLADGTSAGFGSTDHRVNLYGNAVVDLEKPTDDHGVLGEINPVSPLNSDNLFTFQNLSGLGEAISSISMTLPAGMYFDPAPGSGAPNDSGVDGASGPSVSAASDVTGQTFTFGLNNLGVRDTVDVTFSNFDAGEVFEFGVDIEPSNDPADYTGTRYMITFDSGRTVSGFFRNTQDANFEAHDDVIDPTRRDFVAVLGGSLVLTQYEDYGDANQFRDQGQVLIQQNSITDSAGFGIAARAGVRSPSNIPLGGTLPRQGPVRNLQEINTENLVHGIVIENNVVARGGNGGIFFSGDATGGVLGPIPYGRIVNNTVVGDPNVTTADTGIFVTNNAGPTVLNNVVADLNTGVFVSANSQPNTVLGTTLYRGNTTDANTGGVGLGTFAIVLPAGDPLFIDQPGGNYYPAPLSLTIDSSLDTLGDRPDITRVKNPLGISVSPILAPARDVFGQFRGDDPAVAPPSGLGSNVFKDRGAIDRVDFFQPNAIIANPEDGSVNDLDPDPNEIWIDLPSDLRQFIIQLDDEGIGIDDSSVTSAAFELFMDGQLLIDGTDYIFTYNSNTKEVIFTAVTTYEFERFYRIEIDNDDTTDDGLTGVRDLAGNFLAANQVDGTTQFDVLVTDGLNDPPENMVPADQTLPEDSTFTFEFAAGTAITVSDPDVHLGNNELQITLTATDGTLTLGRLDGLTFSNGDGLDDVTMTFTGDVADLNSAMEGMVFTPTPEFVGPATVTILTEDQGQFSGPPSPNASDTDVVTLNYFQVNDAPTFDLPGNPPPQVIEDAGPQTVAGFAANMDAGAPNESGQNLTFTVTLVSSTGNLSFSAGPAIDATTGDLTYTTSPHTNGTATFQVVLVDDGATGGNDRNTSDPQNFTLVVDPINDEPTFDLSGNADPPAVDEDAGEQTISGYLTNIAPGPPEATDEAGQTVRLEFQVVATTGNLAFDTLEIDPVSGDLTYEASADTAGLGLISVTIFDDGTATPPPNDAEGPTRQFTITVNSVDDPPVAVTPDYTIDHGDTLNLDGSGSFDVDIPLGDALTWTWDLDNDGTFGDATGPTPAVPWADLLNFGFTVPGTHTIGLRVLDEPNQSGTRRSDTTTATVTVLAVDYGDAPNSFGTRKPDGAAHVLLPGFSLGGLADSDIDGQTSSNFRGDDNDGIDDEDGITFHTTIEASPFQALSSPFTVDVTAPFAAKLDVWVDFNDDGSFDPIDEHANGGISYNVFNGTQILGMTVPAGATLGNVAARFRLSTSGGLAPTGRVDNGEVEDYRIEIIEVQDPVTPTFSAPGARTVDRTPTFIWTDDTANTSYQFQLRDSDGNLLEDRPNLGVTQFTLASDVPYGEYTARVRSFNRAGDASAWSTDLVFEVVPIAPTIETPNGRVPDSTPTFGWTEIVDVAGYRLQVDNLTTGQVNVINVDVTTNSHTSVDELPLGEYLVRVQAFGGDVFGDFSTDHLISITTKPVITAPDALTFDDTPTIEWDAPFGAGTYHVRVRVNGQSENIVNETGIVGTSFTLPDPLMFGTYRVLVRATSESDPNFYGDVDSEKFKVVVKPKVLEPKGRTTDSSPTIRWTGVNGGETYELRIHNRSTGENNFVRVKDIAALSYTVNDLPVGRYRASVRAQNPLGEFSLWSGPRDFQVVTRPTALTPTGSFFDKQPLFTWDELDGADNYEIRVHKLLSGGDPGQKVLNYIRLVVPNGAVTYGSPYDTSDGVRSNLPNSGYRFWVRGVLDDGLLTEWSQPLSFAVGGQPTLDEIGTTSDRTPTFTWHEIPDAERYILRVRDVTDNSIVLREGQLTGTSFTPTDPLPRGTFRAWLRAVSGSGIRSKWSAPIEFTIVSSDEPVQQIAPDEFVIEPIVPSTTDREVEYLAQIDMPLIAEPVVNVTDPQIEVISEQPIPMPAVPVQRVLPAPVEAEVEELDEVLSAQPRLDWLNDVSAEDLAEMAEGSEASPSLSAGVVGGLLGAGLLQRRRDRKSRRQTKKQK